ncbi:hypothetical protein OZX61_12350 (plasmid) [Acinetobacter sp. ESL0695]|uniref:hypothetical protein n=1 Tax=Acinetobacter sp. ESL0695 TaxID=2983215 RepID=UPI0023F4BEF6|nr:hypothetical protein [Acinetobacter sp. ESL0695]WEV50124.1 hypothetical protein OZX61_12350 [Acinetobacter sp. ESL0695]
MLQTDQQRQLNMTVQQDLNNQSGQIAGLGDVRIHSTQLANQQGALQSAQQVMVESTDLNNQQGMINAGTTVDLQSKHLDNSQQGQIQSQGNVM